MGDLMRRPAENQTLMFEKLTAYMKQEFEPRFAAIEKELQELEKAQEACSKAKAKK